MKGALFVENKPGLLTSTAYIRRLSNSVGQVLLSDSFGIRLTRLGRMGNSSKEGFGCAAFATAISFTAIFISTACLVQVFFLPPPCVQCSCPEERRTDELRNRTAEMAKIAIKAAPEKKTITKMRNDVSKTVEQTAKEVRVRKRRQTTQTAQVSNGNTAFGGYLHNAILRLQQQMIVVQGR